MRNIRERYFSWIVQLIGDDNKCGDYSNLLSHLFDREFTYIVPMDENRYEDGVDLRYKYGYHNGIDNATIAAELDNFPCSILEMMIALSDSMECIMDNPVYGDRTSTWFWNMIESLGLSNQYDARFDPDYVDERLDIFLSRQYEWNGLGGLFDIQDPPAPDVRNKEIWMQAMWYLNEQP